MNVTINGKQYSLPDGATIATALASAGLDPVRARTVVEHNLEIRRATEYDEVKLNDGDTLEVVQFVGGG